MQELITSGDYVILAYAAPIANPKTFTTIQENLVANAPGTILKKEFRYSYDNETFSEYSELNIPSLNTLPFENGKSFWFQFRYILMSGGPVTVNNVNLQYDSFPAPALSGSEYVSIQDQDNISASPITFKTGATWDPYRVNKAVRLYKDLNLMVNSLFGHEVQYYRALPKGRTKDVYLLEYSLYQHDEKQCMKIVVPNNAFPDNKLNMGPFGQDFEMPFEIQIDKDYFQSIFGEGSGPQKRDVIFFPRTNRIYEISSSTIFRDFMNEPLYFKATLIKWQPKSNSEQSSSLDDLESMSVSVEKLFGIAQKEEAEAVSNPQQFVEPTTISDVTRDYLSPLTDIIEEQFMNNYLIIAEHFYKLSSTLTENIVQLDLPDNIVKALVINKTYYARPKNTLSLDDHSSVKKFKYVGVTRDRHPYFEVYAGKNSLQTNHPIFSIFLYTSNMEMFAEEYIDGTDVSIFKCNNYTAQSYQPESVKYSAISSFDINSDRSYSTWFRINSNKRFTCGIRISSPYSPASKEMIISLDRPHDYLIGDFISIQKSNASIEVYAKIIEVIDRSTIKLYVDDRIANYLNLSYPSWNSSWVSASGWYIELSQPRVFIDSMLNNKGIKLELWGKRYVQATFNDTRYFYAIPNTQPNLSTDKWYSICVSMSNLFSQLTMNIWETQSGSSDLKLVYGKVDKNIVKQDRSSLYNYTIPASDMDLTNIRIWSQKIETDKQSLVLNQNIVKDANNAIIIDNAIPQSRLPYISYTH